MGLAPTRHGVFGSSLRIMAGVPYIFGLLPLRLRKRQKLCLVYKASPLASVLLCACWDKLRIDPVMDRLFRHPA